MMLAPALMVQGTASGVGKSLLVTGLCRLFRQEGLRVLPFKAQNMSLNAAVTPSGGEIGRAQAAQAEAAGVLPEVDMNPILIKPEGDSRSQVVVLGRPAGTFAAGDYQRRKPELRQVVAASLERLRRRADLVVIEGAGSPAEINLKEGDLVNMAVAKQAGARVLLVGDIDRGGVFAAFVGTLELLDPDERSLVAAFVVNKFRGDKALLQPGLDWLEARTGRPVLGVLPYLHRLGLADEDSLDRDRRGRRARAGELEIAVVALPRLSNDDDLVPLEEELGVAVRFVDRPEELAGADLVVLPGSKTTSADLAWLRESGLDQALRARARAGGPILGICGGCQMLGAEILDPGGVESPAARTEGLGLLPLRTRFATPKITAQVRVRVATPGLFGAPGATAAGYEIHAGRLELLGPPAFSITERNGQPADEADGAVAGSVTGTLVHGLLEDDAIRGALLDDLRRRRGLALSGARPRSREAAYDRLAAALREHLDLPLLRRLAGLA